MSYHQHASSQHFAVRNVEAFTRAFVALTIDFPTSKFFVTPTPDFYNHPTAVTVQMHGNAVWPGQIDEAGGMILHPRLVEVVQAYILPGFTCVLLEGEVEHGEMGSYAIGFIPPTGEATYYNEDTLIKKLSGCSIAEMFTGHCPIA